MGKYTVKIMCGETMFEFPIRDREDAWYSLDHAESTSGSEKLVLNADREVYAVYTDADGVEHYGTIGSEEDEFLLDNDICSSEAVYCFVENPKTKDHYI